MVFISSFERTCSDSLFVEIGRSAVIGAFQFFFCGNDTACRPGVSLQVNPAVRLLLCTWVRTREWSGGFMRRALGGQIMRSVVQSTLPSD